MSHWIASGSRISIKGLLFIQLLSYLGICEDHAVKIIISQANSQLSREKAGKKGRRNLVHDASLAVVISVLLGVCNHR